MKFRAGYSILPLIATACFPSSALGQERVEEATSQDEEIIVQSVRIRGSLDVAQAPIVELDEADITALGASSVEEMLEAIAPQTGSARGRGGGGRPIILVNGLRIGSFRELRSYPPEAIRKVEVLPEEVAQKFGFAPDRRVVNIIQKEKYSSREIELELDGPDRGDYHATEQEFTLLRVRNNSRLNINIEAEETGFLTEAEREVLQSPGSQSDLAGDPDPAEYRSLLPDSLDLRASVNWAKTDIAAGSSLSANATYNRAESRALTGLNSVTLVAPDGSSAQRVYGEATPLERSSASDTLSLSGNFARKVWGQQLTVTFDGSLAESETQINRLADGTSLINAAASGALAIDADLPTEVNASFDTARSRVWGAASKATLRGAMLDLPAGELSTTFDFGYSWNRIESSDTRSEIGADLRRGDIEAGVNVVLPVTSSKEGVWDALGTFTLNGQLGLNHLSDFGTLHDWSLGLTWSPIRNLDLQATRIFRESAPSLADLGNPQTVTFNVPIFDFVRGETALATVISGGNPDLVAETQRDWKFSANWNLLFWDNTRFSVDYIRNSSRNVTAILPALTADIEAAFPDRFLRDGEGILDTVDARPITYARTRSERLAFGLFTRGNWGRHERRGGAASGRAGLPFGQDGRGRYFLSLTHNVELENDVLIAPGIPLLDLLNGDPASENGLPRNTSRLEFGAFRNGMGLRISGRYTGETRINGSGLPESSDVSFGDIATFNLRFFVDLGRAFKKERGPLKNLRLSFRVRNLFDAQRRIVDSNGDVPLRYQPFLIDPLGRTLRIDLRKMF